MLICAQCRATRLILPRQKSARQSIWRRAKKKTATTERPKRRGRDGGKWSAKERKEQEILIPPVLMHVFLLGSFTNRKKRGGLGRITRSVVGVLSSSGRAKHPSCSKSLINPVHVNSPFNTFTTYCENSSSSARNNNTDGRSTETRVNRNHVNWRRGHRRLYKRRPGSSEGRVAHHLHSSVCVVVSLAVFHLAFFWNLKGKGTTLSLLTWSVSTQDFRNPSSEGRTGPGKGLLARARKIIILFGTLLRTPTVYRTKRQRDHPLPVQRVFSLSLYSKTIPCIFPAETSTTLRRLVFTTGPKGLLTRLTFY